MSDMIANLIYVGDPMCSWCWGFAPEIESLAGDYPVEVVVGGLRPGPMAQPLEDRLADSLGHHWTEIEERTGQPFDRRFLQRRDGWVYDTEPAAIAVAQLRSMNEEHTLAYFTAIQRAFYGAGRDVTDFEVLTELTDGYDIDRDEFAEAVISDEAKKRAWGDFSRARKWGISGFPTLVGRLDDDRLALLARGWAPAATIRDRIGRIGQVVAS